MQKQHDCTPAILREAHATWHATTFGGLLIIHAKGTVANPCYNLCIEKSPLAIWPPQFILGQYRYSYAVCPEVLTDKEICGYFPMAEPPKYITLAYAGGVKEIPVVPNGQCDCPVPLSGLLTLKTENENTRIGYSSVSLQDAFDHALGQFIENGDGDAKIPVVTTKVIEENGFLDPFGGRLYSVTLLRLEK